MIDWLTFLPNASYIIHMGEPARWFVQNGRCSAFMSPFIRDIAAKATTDGFSPASELKDWLIARPIALTCTRKDFPENSRGCHHAWPGVWPEVHIVIDHLKPSATPSQVAGQRKSLGKTKSSIVEWDTIDPRAHKVQGAPQMDNCRWWDAFNLTLCW